jgi:hypothetical protein
MDLILTVQSTANNWRLGFNTIDSISLFEHRELLIIELNSNTIIECRCACGTGKKKAFDINSKVLSEWIVKNSFQIYPPGEPSRLSFIITIANGVKILTFRSKHIL